MKIFHVVGTRPNLMKVSPIWIEIETLTNFNQYLIHTGQHYDLNMSEVIFHDLGLPLPDINFQFPLMLLTLQKVGGDRRVENKAE